MVISQRILRQSPFEKHFLLYDNAVLGDIDEKFFSPDSWRASGDLMDQASGRGYAYAFRYGGRRYFLRHYRRGGMIEPLLKDFYLWGGLRSSRAWREMHLLKAMRECSLPVPLPAAARVVRQGPVYRADIVTRCIPNAATLADRIASGPIPRSLWPRIGACIRRFHDLGFFHADLNAHNVLIDEHEAVWLIDFDKGKRCKPNSGRKQANLTRLQRSLHKVWPANDSAENTAQTWNILLRGYQNQYRL